MVAIFAFSRSQAQDFSLHSLVLRECKGQEGLQFLCQLVAQRIEVGVSEIRGALLGSSSYKGTQPFGGLCLGVPYFRKPPVIRFKVWKLSGLKEYTAGLFREPENLQKSARARGSCGSSHRYSSDDVCGNCTERMMKASPALEVLVGHRSCSMR